MMDIYGVIGHPVRHSMSPALFRSAFLLDGIQAVFTAFDVQSEDLPYVPLGMKAFHMKGLAVTLPYKQALMQHVHTLDETALRVGCLNTLVNREGIITGYNTDGASAVDALKEAFPELFQMPMRVLICGCGGVARSLALELLMETHATVYVDFLVRHKLRAREIHHALEEKGVTSAVYDYADLRAKAALEDDFLDYTLVINATPLGMQHAYQNQTAFPKQWIRSHMVGYDLVYTPEKTVFLKDFEREGARVLGGTAMFLKQANRQYRLWTARDLPASLRRLRSLRHLKEGH